MAETAAQKRATKNIEISTKTDMFANYTYGTQEQSLIPIRSKTQQCMITYKKQ